MKYLEYIETDGSKLLWQLTNANISTSNDIVYFDFMPLSGTVRSDGFYAFAQGSLFVRTWNGGYQVDNARYQVIFYGHSWGESTGPVWNVNTKYECVFSDSNLVRNGTTYNYYTTQSVFTGPIIVNGELDGTTAKRNPVGRYYRIALERNGSLVCDYRPVIDDNNNPCFYDEVSQTYLYHTGTGTPIAGPQLKVPTDLVIGGKTVNSINIGGKDVVSIYDGTTLLWEKPVTPQPTPPSLSDCVCFEALDANTSIRLHASQDYSFFPVNLWYSTDGGTTFSKMDRLTPITLPNIGDKMYVYGSNVSLGQSNLNYVRFLIYDGDVSVSGDLTRLLNPNGLTTLPDYAFVNTFSNNTHLADVSGLTIPVTTVGKSSLAGLFDGCSNITTSPTLQATTLGEGCYENMFNGCTNLNYITCLATDISATNCTTDWVDGVSASGTFTRECSMLDWTTGVNGIPSGWTVLDNCPPPTPTDPDMLHFTAQQANSSVGLNVPSGLNLTLYKSTDGVNFSSWDGTAVTLSNIGDTLWVYGTNNKTAIDSNSYSKFTMSGKIAAAGDVTYLLQNGGTTTLTSSFALCGLFANCTALTTAPELPATTLTDYCYDLMFYKSGITTAPTLNATTLASDCYSYMFSHCTSLVNVQASLPATTIPSDAYRSMFEHCYSLTTAPNLPATNVGLRGYISMFEACINLVNVQQSLPATTLGKEAYEGMFRYCQSLVNAPALPCTTLSTDCYNSMFRDCISLVNAPALPASTIAGSAYSFMFLGCTSLQSINVSATSWNTQNSASWVYNVPSGGTFTKRSGTTIPTGDDGIPTGWTVVNV